MIKRSFSLVLVPFVAPVLGAILVAGCSDQPKSAKTVAAKTPTTTKTPAEGKQKAVVVNRAALAAFKALPKDMASAKNPGTVDKIALGKMLYFDKRLSKNHDISCNSCHDLNTFGVDGEPTSPGHKGQRGGRNSPTVLNAALHISQFWDGRSADVEDQAKGPVMNPVEMAMPDTKRVETTLASMPEYVAAFKKVFPKDNKPTFDNMALAIGAFERLLVTPSPFDAFLNGDDNALTATQKQGLNDYLATGCQVCHLGVGVGGGMYQKLGLTSAWPSQKDQGRYDVTKKDADRMMFKVPSLRNIAKTAPYFHDGATKDLGNAVKLMAKHQLGRELDDTKTKSIISFLESLTGTLDASLRKAPTLPKSTKSTPKPDPS